MIAKNMSTVEEIPKGIVTKTANQIIRRIRKKGGTVTTVEAEHIKLRLLHYDKKRGIELLMKDYDIYGFTEVELGYIYDQMEIERLSYLLKQKEYDVQQIELKKKSEKEKMAKRKSLSKIKNLVNLYGPTDSEVDE